MKGKRERRIEQVEPQTRAVLRKSLSVQAQVNTADKKSCALGRLAWLRFPAMLSCHLGAVQGECGLWECCDTSEDVAPADCWPTTPAEGSLLKGNGSSTLTNGFHTETIRRAKQYAFTRLLTSVCSWKAFQVPHAHPFPT